MSHIILSRQDDHHQSLHRLIDSLNPFCWVCFSSFIHILGPTIRHVHLSIWCLHFLKLLHFKNVRNNMDDLLLLFFWGGCILIFSRVLRTLVCSYLFVLLQVFHCRSFYRYITPCLFSSLLISFIVQSENSYFLHPPTLNVFRV